MCYFVLLTLVGRGWGPASSDNGVKLSESSGSFLEIVRLLLFAGALETC
jgi:hypothetical protein